MLGVAPRAHLRGDDFNLSAESLSSLVNGRA